MAVNKPRNDRGYGLDNALQELAPQPIIATRAPGTNDIAALGTNWIDRTNDAVYTLTSVSAGDANWATAPSSGATTLASLTVTTTTNLQGAATLDDTLDVTGDTTVANLDVTGTLTFTGDLDLTSAALIDLTSTLDADPSIFLHASGGTAEVIRLRSDQGTATNSIDLVSDVGGITLTATASTAANAIDINANAGGIDLDSAGLLALSSSRNDPQAILMEASAGGIDILASGAAAGEDIDIVATGSSVNIRSTEDAANAIFIEASGGTSESINIHADQGVGVESINLESDVGGITLTAGLATDNAINLEAGVGGIDLNAGTQLNLDSSEAAADAIRVFASSAAGGIDVDSGTGGIAIDSTGTVSLDGAAASNFSVSGAGIDLTLASAGGRVVADGAEAAVDAIRIVASDAAGGIDVDCGTGGITIDSTDAISLDGAAPSNFSVSGAGIDLSLESAGGRVVVNGEEAAADAVRIVSAAGGLDADVALQMNLDSSQSAADAIRINASDAAGGIDVDCGTGGIAFDSSGAISLDAAAASNFSVSGAGVDLNLASAGGRIIATAGEDAADAIYLHANAGAAEKIRIHSDLGTSADSVELESDVGGITLTSGLASTDAINLAASSGGVDIDSALEINIASSEASVADAVTISASAADSGITMDAGATPGVTFTNGTQSHQMLVGTGSPNGSVTASQGSLYVDVAGSTSTTILYCNTDGGTTWVGVGS